MSRSTLISIIGRTQLTIEATVPSVRIVSCEFITKLLPTVRYVPCIANHLLLSLKAKWWNLVDGTNDNIIVFVHNILGNRKWTQQEAKHYTKAFFRHLNKFFISQQHCEIMFSFSMESCHVDTRNCTILYDSRVKHIKCARKVICNLKLFYRTGNWLFNWWYIVE